MPVGGAGDRGWGVLRVTQNGEAVMSDERRGEERGWQPASRGGGGRTSCMRVLMRSTGYTIADLEGGSRREAGTGLVSQKTEDSER